MSNLPPVTFSIDAEGIGWILFDDPAGRANILNQATREALHAAVDALAAQPVRAVVIGSAKDRIFVAGADLGWLAGLTDVAAATAAARAGQELFERLAGFKVPVVCAIHGACAGGGCELALACDWRIASDAPQTVIGLPEVNIGLIPGWGGSTRLPRLVGAERAVEFMLQAALVPAAEAYRTGLVDEVVPAAEWKQRARAAALRLASAGRPVRAIPPAASADFFSAQRRRALSRRRGQPAPAALLAAVEQGAGLPLAAALDLEANLFGGIAAGAVAKNLIHVFQLKERARKFTLDAWFPATGAEAPGPPGAPFRTIGIVGAGVMGSGIAHWCAVRGLGVILCDTSRDALERGVGVIRELFAESVRRGEVTADLAHRMTGGIGITTSLEDFEMCDLVVEAIVEDVAAKQALLGDLSRAVGPLCVIATNTSALPLEELAARMKDPGRLVGLHFFNPVARMPLVELVLGAQTTRPAAERALAFARRLERTPVVVRSAPGFLVTRVLFFALNEACRLWELGVPAVVMDEAMRDWGWPMGPMRLIDEVGVDVTELIFGELKHYYSDRFAGTAICGRLRAAGLLGRKNGAGSGFYAYAGPTESPNPALGALPSAPPDPRFGPEEIRSRLHAAMVAEAKRALAEGVVKSADEADLALLLGAGFPAFRGGLLWQDRRAGPPAG